MRVRAAQARRLFPGGPEDGQPGRVGQHQAVEERHVEPLSLAGALAMEQRGDDPLAGGERAHGVDHGHVAEHGAPVGLAGDGHQATHGLHEHVDPGFSRQGPVGPKAESEQ